MPDTREGDGGRPARQFVDEIAENDMDSLLKHMVDMTGHRDHAMLDISVISAVQELAGAAQTRILTIAVWSGQRYLRARAAIVKGGQARLEDTLDGAGDPAAGDPAAGDPAAGDPVAGIPAAGDPVAGIPAAGDPVAAYPELAQCLAQRRASAEAIDAHGMRTLWLPIWFGDTAGACLEIRGHAAFSNETLHMVGGIVGVYRNFQNLLDYSERDSLTGLLNRKTFDDQLARMLQQPASAHPGQRRSPERRQPQPEERQWLAVVDVDHFKAVNDRFGHLYGDEVLILIANLMQAAFRAQDRVFRFGGEEFVVLLRSSTLENAWKIIDRFRSNVANHVFPQVGQVTVSVGFVGIGAHDSPVVTLGHADQALYHAKSSGRNRACHYDDLITHGVLHAVASNDTAEFF